MAAVAFLGLGTMGQGMVRNLLAAGHSVTVYNRHPEKMQPVVALGARAAESPEQAVADAEAVLYCLSDDEAVSELVLAEGGLAQTVPEGALAVDLSTVSPDIGLREHAAFRARGVRFLDAPVFGSRGEAADGGLWIVVGGEEADVEAARPLLEPLAASLHHMGGPGSGQRMKLVGNLLVASQVHALGEALTLAEKSGLDLQAVLGVLDVTDFRTPIYSGVGRSVLEGDYSPNFALHLMLKDLNLLKQLGDEVDVDLPSVQAAAGAAEEGVEGGLGALNASALIKVLAQRAGVHLP